MLSKIISFALNVSFILLLTYEVTNASLVVASKDSTGKKRADYICDGIDDQVEIQKAINALPLSGGMVELLEGTFNFSDCVEITKSNVTIKGVGKASVLKHIPTKWIKLAKDATKNDEAIILEDTSQFRVGQLIGITDVKINPPVEPGTTYYYYGNYYVKSEIHIITSISDNKIILERPMENTVTQERKAKAAPAWPMIKAYGKTDIELRDFSIDCNRDNVARVFVGQRYSHHPGPEPARSADYKCPFPEVAAKLHHGEELTSAIYMDSAHNSQFRNLYLHDIPMSGIFLIDSNYILVEGNTIRDFGLKGYVDCFGDFTQIIGNIIENSLYEDGIAVYGRDSNYAIVSNNILRNCPRTNIGIGQARRTVVIGNNIFGGGGGGAGISVVSQDATVTGNYIENVPVGMYVITLPGLWKINPSDCAITLLGNSLRNCGIGFIFNKTCNANLIGNSVVGTLSNVFVSDTEVNDLIISNNQFLNTNQNASAALKVAGDNNFIFGNKIKGFKEGILLEVTSEKNIVESNEFIDVSEKILDQGKENIKEKNV